MDEETLRKCQTDLHSNPKDQEFNVKEQQARENCVQSRKDMISFFSQKAKDLWLKKGDPSTTYFHKAIKMRQYHSSIHQVVDKHQILRDSPKEVVDAFIDFYKELLDSSNKVIPLKEEVVHKGSVVSEEQAKFHCSDYTRKEIKDAIFSIPNGKAPEPDGYNSFFFKENWEIIGDDW